jgi:brefeldin A-inhibited guanine nucleotide-exchange protein
MLKRRDADIQFINHLPTFYPLVTDILGKEVAPEMRLAVRDYLIRVGRVKGISQSSSGGDNAVAGST